MSNPWDPLPFPKRGDDSEGEIFLGVGRVMTEWEYVEFGLARLHSTFVGAPDDNIALREYGEGRIFRDRLDATKRAADKYFIQSPTQDIEGTFLHIEAHARGFSERRNEVAHGVVFKISRITAFAIRMGLEKERDQYALIPPYHTLLKHNDDGFPKYAYTSVELLRLRDLLVVLGGYIGDFRLHLIG